MPPRSGPGRPAPVAEPLTSLDALAQALRCLPGVGPRAAQRMALHLLQHDRDGARRLADALVHATQAVRHCERCNTFTEEAVCALCRSGRRDPALLCVVETPADLVTVELRCPNLGGKILPGILPAELVSTASAFIPAPTPEPEP